MKWGATSHMEARPQSQHWSCLGEAEGEAEGRLMAGPGLGGAGAALLTVALQ